MCLPRCLETPPCRGVPALRKAPPLTAYRPRRTPRKLTAAPRPRTVFSFRWCMYVPSLASLGWVPWGPPRFRRVVVKVFRKSRKSLVTYIISTRGRGGTDAEVFCEPIHNTGNTRLALNYVLLFNYYSILLLELEYNFFNSIIILKI